MPRNLLLFAFSICLIGSSARPAGAIPADDLLNSLQPSGDVNDYAGLLSPAEREQLEARCRLLRERSGAQLAVVILKSLQGGQIEDFEAKLFRRWGVGQREKNNGLMLLIAMEERQSRIEVGYGLEGIVPDALAARILDHQLRPRFREQRYAAGLTDAVNALCELVERGEPAGVVDRLGAGLLPLIAFLALFVAIGGFMLGAGLGAKATSVVMTGLFFAGIPFAMGAVVAAPWAPIAHSLVGLAAGALGWLAGRSNLFNPSTWPRGRHYDPNAWTWGDLSSGWPSGDSSGGWSGGGFSQSWGGFGGGSSGGGGATSSW